MGKRSKERNLVANATRRRPVLGISRVSRKEVANAPPKATQGPVINPNSISGIGLLGNYADDSDEENTEEKTTANASQPESKPNQEIDNQLADFFKEIRSMESETTSGQDEATPQQGDIVEENQQELVPVENYPEQEDPNYPWQACLDSNSNSYYYWNMETNEVQWEPPAGFQFQTSDAVNGEQDEVYSRTSYDADECYHGDNDRQDDDDDDESSLHEEPVHENGCEKTTQEDIDGIPLVDVNQPTNHDDDTDADDDDDKDSNYNKSKLLSKRTLEDPTKGLSPKRTKFTSESVEDFADQLLEDTYDQVQQDIRDEENMEMSDDEDKKADENLLPPEAFQHDDSPAEFEKIRPVSEERQNDRTEAEEEEYRIKIMDKTALLNNKLNFLNINTREISNLHVLFIEMETRIRDWRDGALNSQHLVKKLQEADEHLKNYEESAAPPGWSCHWDRYGFYF